MSNFNKRCKRRGKKHCFFRELQSKNNQKKKKKEETKRTTRVYIVQDISPDSREKKKDAQQRNQDKHNKQSARRPSPQNGRRSKGKGRLRLRLLLRESRGHLNVVRRTGRSEAKRGSAVDREAPRGVSRATVSRFHSVEIA